MIKKSITVTEKQEEWIQARVATGQYASDSEVVREALRGMQNRMAEIERIRAALIAAEERGESALEKEAIRAAVQSDMKRDGRL